MKMLILISIISLGLFYTMNAYFLAEQRQLSGQQARQSIHMVQEQMKSLLSNDQALRVSMTAPENTSFTCLVDTSVNCTYQSTTQEFHLYNAKGEKVTASRLLGFDRRGQKCELTEPSCLFGYTMKWRPLCPSTGVCLSPLIEIVGELTYRRATDTASMALNPERFRIYLVRSPPP